MKPFVFLSALFVLLMLSPARADIAPVDSDAPLFCIYAATEEPKDSSTPSQLQTAYDSNKPLLVVSSLRDLFLQADHKGVRALLTEHDAALFARATRENHYLVLIAKEGVTMIMRIHAPIEDGSIMFDYPQKAAIAAYLRQRYGVPDAP